MLRIVGVRREMELRGLQGRELAVAVGCCAATISAASQGRPLSLETARRIAQVLQESARIDGLNDPPQLEVLYVERATEAEDPVALCAVCGGGSTSATSAP